MSFIYILHSLRYFNRVFFHFDYLLDIQIAYGKEKSVKIAIEFK